MEKVYKVLVAIILVIITFMCVAMHSFTLKISDLQKQKEDYQYRIESLEESSREMSQMLTLLDEKVEIQNNVFNSFIRGELSKDWGGEE